MRYLVLLALVGCTNPTAPFVPLGAVPWDPPAATIDSLWHVDEACSGLRGDWRSLEWYLVPGVVYDTPNGPATGSWDGGRNIYVSTDAFFEGRIVSPGVIRHEMLHVLLRGDPSHASTTWAACGLS